MYFGVAIERRPAPARAKDKLKEAFAAAKVPALVEVYPARHGWCVADMPTECRLADLQRARGRARLGPAARALQGRPRLSEAPSPEGFFLQRLASTAPFGHRRRVLPCAVARRTRWSDPHSGAGAAGVLHGDRSP
jgi:hypothetical protein